MLDLVTLFDELTGKINSMNLADSLNFNAQNYENKVSKVKHSVN